MTKLLSALILMLAVSWSVNAKEFQNHTAMMEHGEPGEGHLMDMQGGMVMGQNTDTLPGGCESISEVKEITVHAGHKYAEKFPGTMFAFDTQALQFEPCTKLTVHFINDDDIRHQWMMHGLPKYLYPKGMFHLEVSGPGEVSGTLILPSDNKTYLVHCDIAQHMEKGMKAQLKVGKGSGDLPSIPGLTNYVIADDYSDVKSELPAPAPVVAPAATAAAQAEGVVGSVENVVTVKSATPDEKQGGFISGVTVIGLAIGLILAAYLKPRLRNKTPTEAVTYLFEILSDSIIIFLSFLKNSLSFLFKSKALPKG